MEIKPRTRYKTGRGMIESVYGETSLYPQFMWSLGGNWYAKEDGRFVHFVRPVVHQGKVIVEGHYERNSVPTGLDLVEELKDDDEFWIGVK